MSFRNRTIIPPTRAEIEARVDRNGKGATRSLLASWGVPWPPPKGWKKELLSNADQTTDRPKFNSETWEIITIMRKDPDGTFMAKAEGRDHEGNKVGEVVAESKSLARVVEILAPAKPINI